MDRYGDYDLQRGDRDALGRYGGLVQSGPASWGVQLQRDLRELGFLLVGQPDGDFGRRTQWAVREFQLYARMAAVAQEAATVPGAPARYSARLSPAVNPAPYAGPASGVVNAETRAALEAWLGNRWRCPVVMEAWNLAGGQPATLAHPNLWLHNELTGTVPRVYVRDFRGYYPFPATQDPDALTVLGEYVNYLQWGGPRSEPPQHTWPEGELLPEALVGLSLANLSPEQRSTYKVIRAVAEQECVGYFDCLNAYDNALVSLGPCHWTLGLVDEEGVKKGELCGYLAYLHHADPAAFDQAVGAFGVRVAQDRVDQAGVPNGKRLFQAGQRKYAGWLAQEGEDGAYQPASTVEAEANYFKSWHWFYRFSMARRTVEGFRRGMWTMARVRLRDLLSAPWGSGVPEVPASGGSRPATLGDMFTSERAMALILRWHIRSPAHVISSGRAGGKIRNAPARAGLPGTAGTPTSWTDAHEAALIQGLLEEAETHPSAGFLTTMRQVAGWPGWAGGSNPRRYRLDSAIGRLAKGRGSFRFHGANLPPVPY